MLRVGFKSMIPVLQREKADRALDRAAIVIDSIAEINTEKYECIYIDLHTHR
jgi:hypothetical protein